MSTVLVVAPIVVANWSVITAAVTAAVSAAGYTMIQHAHTNLSEQTSQREVIDVDNSEILENAAGTDQQIVVQRDGVTATFKRDPHGTLQLCVEGNHLSKSQLRAIGEDLIGRVTQQYAYHRLVTELKNRGMQIVDEEVTESESVKIRVRNW
ncbi:MAG: DUF1257 domain-containing protein [Planctomycetota bacterium]